MNVAFNKLITKVHNREMWIYLEGRMNGWLSDQNECATATKTSKQTSASSDLDFGWNIISRERKITVLNSPVLILERGRYIVIKAQEVDKWPVNQYVTWRIWGCLAWRREMLSMCVLGGGEHYYVKQLILNNLWKQDQRLNSKGNYFTMTIWMK